MRTSTAFRAAQDLTDAGRALRRQLRKLIIRRVALIAGGSGLLLAVVAGVTLLGVAAVVGGAPEAATAETLGIPARVLATYQSAERAAPRVAPGCAVTWPILAGIWKVESDHGTSGGREVGADGVVTPPLYGPVLDGSIPGTAAVADTDQGRLDNHTTWDRAVGPAQMLPATWATYGRGEPQQVDRAALATVAHLCLKSPGDYTRRPDLEAALLGYNNSRSYIAEVVAWIGYYQAFNLDDTDGPVTVDGLYAFPLPADSVTVEAIRRPHHDYPAWDGGVPEGTPVYAAHPGTVVAISTPCANPMECRCGWGIHIAGSDGHTYGYCHARSLQPVITVGVEVSAGQPIMASGNTGNSLSPHLHFQIRNPEGALVCPQGPLQAWWNGIALTPAAAPTTGCTY